jgi:hypothetical protein
MVPRVSEPEVFLVKLIEEYSSTRIRYHPLVLASHLQLFIYILVYYMYEHSSTSTRVELSLQLIGVSENSVVQTWIL